MPTSAFRVDALLNTLGVNTHIDYTDGQYADINADIADLQYLGISFVRDAAPNPANQGQANLGLAADAGIKFIFYADGSIDPASVVQQLDNFIQAHPGSITDIEGPNEVNNQPVTYQGLTGTAAAQAYQLALYDDVKADPLLSGIPVLGFTDYPNASSASDFNNIHPYAQNGDQPLDSILAAEAGQDAVQPGEPFVITETGYHTFTVGAAGGGAGAVDDNTQAELLLNSYMDAISLGVKATYLYQLLDAYPDPGGTNPEDHFGLFNLDNSPKPAAVAIHDLTTILSDSGANASSFATGTLNYSISNFPATANSYLAEKSDGTFDVIVWNEPDIWDSTNNVPVTVPSTDVTVNLGQTFSTVQVFDPLIGSTPIETLHNVSSVDLGLSDDLLIVQVSGGTNGQTTVIQTDGSTSLTEVGSVYYLFNNGSGPELSYGGAVVVAGQFGDWVPIGAVQTSSGYEVAWKDPGANQYTIWNTDSNGNFTAYPIGFVSATSLALESLETVFHQDLNGDGVIGVPAGVVIQTDGSTSLTEAGSNYYLVSNGSGPELSYGDAAVVAGQFGDWVPIGAVQTSSGYEVAWKDPGANQYTIWDTDSNGNFTSYPIGFVSATSLALESLETVFHQDLNGDGVIGVPAGVVIQTDGSTSLTEVGSNYYLVSNGSGPELSYGGAVVVAGQFGDWVPIGAVQTSSGYEVAWKDPGANQYTIWDTDSNGNFTAYPIGFVSATSLALESLETVFHQDLNGDGVIGVPAGVVIQTDGSTSLTEAGSNYYLVSNGSGPELSYGGAVVVAGQFGDWVPIGAVQTSSGYEVAWKDPGANQYTIWDTDSNGNFTSYPIGFVSGTSPALEAFETAFQQDLNGDGVIGSVTTVGSGATVELGSGVNSVVIFAGATGDLVLDQSTTFLGQILGYSGNGSLSGSDQLDLKDIAFASGVSESYTGNSSGGELTITDGKNDTAHLALSGDYVGSTFQLSSDGHGGTIVIDPVVSETASGTLSLGAANSEDTYSVEVMPVNNSSVYLGNFVVDAASATNGQESVGWHFNFDGVTTNQPITQSYNVSLLDQSPQGATQTSSQVVSVTIGGPGNNTFVFHPGIGTDVVANAKSTDTFNLSGFASITNGNQLSELLHAAQIGQPQSVFASANDGHDTTISLDNHYSVTLANVQLASLHANNFIIS